MRISVKQKELNRQSLLRAAVEVIAENGYEETSLRQISQVAGLSEPVIYSYFPNKQSLLFAYWQDSLERALATLSKVDNLSSLPFAEQVQRLMETHIEILEEDMAFVEKTFPLVFVTGLASAQESLSECRKLFATFVRECLDEAIQAGELKAPPFIDTVVSMFWDFHVGILHYRLQDKSELQTATSEIMQRSMAVINEVLKSGFLPRLVDLAYFLIRTHLLSPALNAAATNSGGSKARPKVLDRFND